MFTVRVGIKEKLRLFCSKEDGEAGLCELQSSHERLQPQSVGRRPNQKGAGASPGALLNNITTAHRKVKTHPTALPHQTSIKLPGQPITASLFAFFISIIN